MSQFQLKSLFVSLVIFSSLALHAAESSEGKKVKKDLSGYGTMDMNQFNSLKNSEASVDNIKVGMTCRNDEGIEIPADSPQFGPCMQRAQAKALEKSQGNFQDKSPKK